LSSRFGNTVILILLFVGIIGGISTALVVGQDASPVSLEESFGAIVLERTAALTGNAAHPCRIVVYQPAVDTAVHPKPERLVIYDYQDGKILWQCYRDDVFLEKAGLLQYYVVTKIEFADVDSDGIKEAVISWDSDCAGSGWTQTLEVLDYDLETKEFRSYREGITAAGPFGGFKVVSLDLNDKVQRVFAYSYVNDDMNGEECRWCPHRYRIAVYMLAKDGLVVDPHWNNGEIVYTQLRFASDEYDTLNEHYLRSSLYNALAPGAPFMVLSPQPNQTVSLPFSLRVEVPQDMKELGFRVLSTSSDGTEKVLLDDMIAGWAYEPSISLKVEDSVYYAAPTSTAGMIVLYDPANPDNRARRLSIPIFFAPVETVTVKVYFPNTQRETDSLASKSVYPVERTIPATTDIARAALTQLFRGPTASEKEEGFFSYLFPSCKAQNVYYPEHPCSVKLKGLEIKDGVVQVWVYDIDWDEISGIGGLRTVEIALLQIEQTLLQFSEVFQVVIHRPP